MINTVFWDWNGTLLDDAAYEVDCINTLLERRNMPKIDLKRYYEVFGFPVIDFYKRLGFDFEKESFDDVAVEYTDRYNNGGVDDVPFRKGVSEALAVYKDKGLKQVLLSASEKKILTHGIALRKVENYFCDVLALDNIYAESKTGIALEYLKNNPDSKQGILIGDTEHDYFVAQTLGIDCVLVRGGHASGEALLSTGAPVVNEVNETYRYVLQTGRGFCRERVCDVSFTSRYKAFYDDLKNTNKTEDW